MTMSPKLLIATTNAGKAREIAAIFADLPLECIHLGEIDPSGEMPEAVEDGKTFEENAVIKALHYGELTRLSTVAEDAGLEVPALDGWPGVHSARVAESDRERVALVLDRMKGKTGDDREARFMSVAAFLNPGTRELKTFRGVLHGNLIDAPKGENGFGYDPIFWHSGYGKTLAELSTRDKNLISHRGQSFRALARWLKSYEW